MTRIQPFMVRDGDQQHVTEDYVSVPPALTITDEAGAIWTLGFRNAGVQRGEFAFNVLRNGIEIGMVANRLERQQGRVRAFTETGWQCPDMRVRDGDRLRVVGIGARLTRERLVRRGVVDITVWRDGPFGGTPVAQFAFTVHPHRVPGAVWEPASREGVVCKVGQWLHATIQPATLQDDVELRAQLAGGAAYREIPVQRSVIKE